jgi:hypothetical protein
MAEHGSLVFDLALGLPMMLGENDCPCVLLVGGTLSLLMAFSRLFGKEKGEYRGWRVLKGRLYGILGILA